MDVDDREKHRRAIHMGVPDEPAPVDVAHYSLDRIESESGTRRILRGKNDTGNDHDHQHDPGERAVVPPITKVPRGRIFIQLMIKELDKGQPIIDPANHPARGTWAFISHGPLLSDGYDSVAGEFVKGLTRHIDLPRQPQIQWGRTLTNSRGGVVDGAMARTKPAAGRTSVVTGLLTRRDAAEMRADADDDQPFGLLNAIRILLGVTQLRDVDVLCRLDLLGRPMGDEDRCAAPGDSQTRTDLDRREIDFGGRQRQCIARRVQSINKRPDCRDETDATNRSGGKKQEVA